MQLYVATRKGLFIIDPARWTVSRPYFLGDPVTAVLAHGGAMYAALNLGHFGVKLRRSDNGGESWTELAPPAYPASLSGVLPTSPRARPAEDSSMSG